MFYLVLLLLVFGKSIYDSFYQMVFYGRLHGYKSNVFGYPASFLEVSFNFSIAILSIVTLIYLFRFSKLSWYFASSIMFFFLLMIFLQEVNLLSIYVGYFNWEYMIYFFALGWFLYFLNLTKVKVVYRISKTYWLYQGVFVVVLFLLWFVCK